MPLSLTQKWGEKSYDSSIKMKSLKVYTLYAKQGVIL